MVRKCIEGRLNQLKHNTHTSIISSRNPTEQTTETPER
jgi:hypothetical protein